MSIVCCRLVIRLTVPSSTESAQGVDAWLASINDSCWRVLTDFRNWSDWAQAMRSGKQKDSQAPAKGTKPQVDSDTRSHAPLIVEAHLEDFRSVSTLPPDR